MTDEMYKLQKAAKIDKAQIQALIPDLRRSKPALMRQRQHGSNRSCTGSATRD